MEYNGLEKLQRLIPPAGYHPPMKPIIRLFFRTLRVALGPVMLLKERLTQPTGVVRAPAQQQAVDAACRQLVLYQFATCPFCVKVRQEMRRLSLPIEKRDAQHDGPHRQALLAGSSATQVPQKVR